MMLIHIVAINEKNVIGKDLDKIWINREDLRFFRQKTFNKIVILGRIAYEAIKELKHRTFVVISSKKRRNKENVYFVKTIKEALDLSKSLEPDKDIFIAGGESIYKQTESHIEKIYLSRINNKEEGNKHYFIPDGFNLRELISYESFDLYVYEIDKF